VQAVSLVLNGGDEDRIVAHLASLLRPGGCLYLVDADGTAMRMMPEDIDLEDLQQCYLTFHTAQGDDVRAGLRLGERLVRAELETAEIIEIGMADDLRPIPSFTTAAQSDVRRMEATARQ
jgi:hypothetical protein